MSTTRTTLRRIGVFAAILALPAVPAAAAASPKAVRFSLPAPTGPYPVGSTDLHLVDPARQDPWVAGVPRELMITVRYPALPNASPKTPYMAPGVAQVMAEDDAANLSVGADQLDYRVPTNASAGTRADGGHRPVLFKIGARAPSIRRRPAIARRTSGCRQSLRPDARLAGPAAGLRAGATVRPIRGPRR